MAGKVELAKVASHLRKRLLHYTIATIILALIIGNAFPQFSKIPKEEYSYWVMLLAILTILPSTIMLRGWELPKAVRMWKETLLAVIYAFLLSPFLAYLLAFNFPEATLRVGFFLSNIVPISSAALSYVMIAGGNIELATVILVTLAILTLPLTPLYLAIYGSMISVHVPVMKIVKVILIVLFIPLLIGQIIRYLTAKKRHLYYVEKELKPFLSTVAMISLLALVFSLVLRKAPTIIRRPEFAVMIWVFQGIIAFTMIFVTLAVDKLLKIRYENHQALAFVSITKNQSIPAAIAISSIGKLAVLPPALIPAIQPVLAVAYLHMEDWVRRFLGSEREKRR